MTFFVREQYPMKMRNPEGLDTEHLESVEILLIYSSNKRYRKDRQKVRKPRRNDIADIRKIYRKDIIIIGGRQEQQGKI